MSAGAVLMASGTALAVVGVLSLLRAHDGLGYVLASALLISGVMLAVAGSQHRR
jgi:hypothetical protein